MKKIFKVALVSVILLSIGTMAFANSLDGPRDIYARLVGKNLEDVYEEKGSKTYGELAKENGVFDEFREEMLKSKIEILNQRVSEGVITKEEAEAILKTIKEDCTMDPSNSKRLGQEYGLGFGKGFGNGNGRGNGYGAKGKRGQGQGYRWNSN